MNPTMNVAGVDVYVTGPASAAGPGETASTDTVIMIHGWPDTYRLWDAQVSALSQPYSCVRFTLPGFEPDSDRKAHSIGEVLDTIGAVVDAVSPDQPVVLLLHDWGCVFGDMYRRAHQSRVARVVMADIGDANSPELDAELSRAAKVMRATYQATLAAVAGRGRWRDRVTRAVARAIDPKGRHAEPIHAGMNYPYRGARAIADEPVLGGDLGHPTLFLYAKKKPFMFHSQAWAQRLAATKGCAVHEFATGHWLMRDDPTRFNEIVLDWLSQP